MSKLHRTRFYRIMVALDGSAGAEAALPFALNFAAGRGSTLLLLFVTPGVISPGITHSARASAEMRRHNLLEGRHYLQAILAALTPAWRAARMIVAEGDAVTQIAEVAAQESIDLIVLSEDLGIASDGIPVPVNQLTHCTSVPVLMIPGQIRLEAPRLPPAGAEMGLLSTLFETHLIHG